MIHLKKIMSLTFASGMSLFLLQNSAWGAQNTLELHSGSVKLIREGKSQIIRTAGEKLQLLANDRLQTGGNTDISLYLRDGDDTVKLYSNSFFKLDDSSDEGNSVALLIGRLNFSVKPLPENAGAEEEAVDNSEKKTERDFGIKRGKHRFSLDIIRARIQMAVEDGRLTQAEADEKISIIENKSKNGFGIKRGKHRFSLDRTSN